LISEKGSEKSGLSCAGGIGSSMQVTASFALTAVAYVINRLIETGRLEEKSQLEKAQ